MKRERESWDTEAAITLVRSAWSEGSGPGLHSSLFLVVHPIPRGWGELLSNWSHLHRLVFTPWQGELCWQLLQPQVSGIITISLVVVGNRGTERWHLLPKVPGLEFEAMPLALEAMPLTTKPYWLWSWHLDPARCMWINYFLPGHVIEAWPLGHAAWSSRLSACQQAGCRTIN